ncbi:MAG: J domain-containing protein [Ilumatobacter sp.]|uniref:J domain-containing protein n=1 Tax=Ilumatobacter sp. TaxID=1967498 RepID=UPI002635759F|nr:J domain-containing protein [Ilumatobacter sp.]MDJ0769927.1 J domain-containing protein [Ilumatobacter sp.]
MPARDAPFAVLGLRPDATADEIHAARRRLAKQQHPDVGGSIEGMQRINRAAAEALALIELAADTPPEAPPPGEQARDRAAAADRTQHGRREYKHAPRRVRSDHPSFTIEALPAEAFEGLLIVGNWLGDVLDDDPPYLLELALDEPVRGWCGVEVVPDAGASTVSLRVAGLPGGRPPDIDDVRDAWIEGLNRLDWGDQGPAAPPPS